MLTAWPNGETAVAVAPIWDITEETPIPQGATVWLQDFCDNLWIVEYQDRIYMATPEELQPHFR